MSRCQLKVGSGGQIDLMLLRCLLAGGRIQVEDSFQGPEIAMAHDALETSQF